MDAATMDAYAPTEMAKRVEESGVRRAVMRPSALIPLAVLAGAFIGLEAMLSTVAAKCALPFGTAFVLGALCNALVCLAVWLCFSARSTTDKILCIVFPITAFVALMHWFVYLRESNRP